mgnify:CR=1 FL=1|tara:strand:- start:449 stop:601 length:153 start_codon:yes stop_codon:yes gene_type:complete
MEIFVALCIVVALLVLISTTTEGTKGITNEYTSKSGRTRTARKSREEHIV